MATAAHLVKITLQLEDKLSSNLASSATSLKQFGASLTSLGTQMTAAFTVPIVAMGTAAVNASMEFDKSMRNIQSISHDTDAQIAALGQQFKDMSMDMSVTVDSAQNLSDAFYDIQSSGFAGDDAMKVLEASTKAASAGLTTTKVAAQALTGVLNAYGASADEASRYSDIMFQTVNRGVVTFEQLSGALGNVTGVAAQLGVSFEELGAAISTMTKQSISADTATTNLNAILTSLISPTEAMSQAFTDLGYSSGSAMLDALGLGGTLEALSKYAGGSAEKMQDLFGNVRALRGALALTGKGAGMFADDLAAMQASAGATQEAFAIQMQSFAAAWQHFQNVATVALMEAGDIILPILAQIMNAVAGLLEWWIKLDDTTQSWILGILAVVAAIGPVLLIIGQLIAAFSAIAAVIPMLAAGFAILLNPVTLIVAALVLLALAIFNNWGGIRDFLMDVFNAIVTAIYQFINAASQAAGQAGAAIGAIPLAIAKGWDLMLEKAQTSLTQLGGIIAVGFMKAFNGAVAWVSGLGKLITDTLSTLGSQMMILGQTIIEGLLNGIKSKAVDLVAYVFGLSKDLTGAIKSALGIHSPSKVMMKLGQQTAQGFQDGINSLNTGIGVNAPKIAGGMAASRPALAASGGGSGGGGIGSVTINVYSNQDPKAIAKEVNRELAKEYKRKK